MRLSLTSDCSDYRMGRSGYQYPYAEVLHRQSTEKDERPTVDQSWSALHAILQVILSEWRYEGRYFSKRGT